MLSVGAIREGYVFDHIKAGTCLQVYHYLKLDETDYAVAMIMNVNSSKMGKKDILKIECELGAINLDIIGFLDHNITVNLIKDEQIVEKKELHLPLEVRNIIRCKNPRCITSVEQELDQIFYLSDPEKIVYRCMYCDTSYKR